MIGSVELTICIHGKLLMDCRKCTDIEEFDTDEDDGSGAPKWFMDFDDIPISNGGNPEELQVEDYQGSGIDSILNDERYWEASYACVD